LLSRDLASLAIDLSPNPARAVLIVVTALGLVGSTFLPNYWAWMAVATVFAASCAQAWRMGLIGRRYALCQLQCDSEGSWWVHSSDGKRVAIRLRSGSRVGPNIIWLAVRGLDGARTQFWILLLPLGVPDPVWRGLQARLRWLSVIEASPDMPKDDSFVS